MTTKPKSLTVLFLLGLSVSLTTFSQDPQYCMYNPENEDPNLKLKRVWREYPGGPIVSDGNPTVTFRTEGLGTQFYDGSQPEPQFYLCDNYSQYGLYFEMRSLSLGAKNPGQEGSGFPTNDKKVFRITTSELVDWQDQDAWVHATQDSIYSPASIFEADPYYIWDSGPAGNNNSMFLTGNGTVPVDPAHPSVVYAESFGAPVRRAGFGPQFGLDEVYVEGTMHFDNPWVSNVLGKGVRVRLGDAHYCPEFCMEYDGGNCPQGSPCAETPCWWGWSSPFVAEAADWAPDTGGDPNLKGEIVAPIVGKDSDGFTLTTGFRSLWKPARIYPEDRVVHNPPKRYIVEPQRRSSSGQISYIPLEIEEYWYEIEDARWIPFLEVLENTDWPFSGSACNPVNNCSGQQFCDLTISDELAFKYALALSAELPTEIVKMDYSQATEYTKGFTSSTTFNASQGGAGLHQVAEILVLVKTVTVGYAERPAGTLGIGAPWQSFTKRKMVIEGVQTVDGTPIQELAAITQLGWETSISGCAGAAVCPDADTVVLAPNL